MNFFSKISGLFKKRPDGEKPVIIRAIISAVLFLSLVFTIIKCLVSRGKRRNDR